MTIENEQALEILAEGMPVLGPTGDVYRVSAELAAEFEPGDTVIANEVAGLLHIPQAIRNATAMAMTNCMAAFDQMRQVSDEQIEAFFTNAANNLADDLVWAAIADANTRDVAQAAERGRSTTRLVASESMRKAMIEGLLGWVSLQPQRDRVLEKVSHVDFDVELIGAALGPVGFVFEGRPNVLADACGVLRGGNTVIFRIGSDALGTATAIMQQAIEPALQASGLPAGAITLLDSSAHAAGWSLFLDDRLALAVARGSGRAVDLLGSLAQSVGTPVSLHGTGGAWMFLGGGASALSVEQAVSRSLDRKVCNTLNVCCVLASQAGLLMPAVLAGIAGAAAKHGQSFKLHVTENAETYVPDQLFSSEVSIVRAAGPCVEPQAERIDTSNLALEWEWEESPEVSLVVVDSLADAIGLFNAHSPRLVATLISDDAEEQDWFYSHIEAPFIGDDHTRWVDGQLALAKPELGLSNWANGRLLGRGGILTGDSIYTIRTRYRSR